ncbi:exocyst complex component Sec10 [Brevipalpus obovatus]|uniref:exocyst complex component Sec10 n=1 Tax=Brevipalpus obovatus TaxID=246614 RepID=UPI003D9DD7EC
MGSYMVELEMDPFDPKEFVERLAWRAVKDRMDSSTPECQTLFDEFESRIKDLRDIYETHEKKCERLEMVCKEVEKRHWSKIAELQKKCKLGSHSFDELNEKLEAVAAKVVYLGEQLEGVNTPRSRAVEAMSLLKEFALFFNEDSNSPNYDIDPSQLFEKADVIQKLYKISQKLPTGAKYENAKKKIEQKYYQVEKDLIDEFFLAQVRDDRSKMREISNILSQFQGYNACKDAFIEKSQSGIFLGVGIFNDIVPLCEKSLTIVQEVFTDPDRVMSKFVLNIYKGKLQEYIQSRLENDQDSPEEYLTTLHELYCKMIRLSNQLAHSKIMGVDLEFLNTLTRQIFDQYLSSYVDIEMKALKTKCELILQHFYTSKNHQKRPVIVGSIQELKRDIQAKIGRASITIGSINVGASNSDTKIESLLSEEVAINILQETKLALQRCQVLSMPANVASNAMLIFEMELNYLCTEHIDYALDVGSAAIPMPEPKSQPELNFFEIAHQCNAICHLFEKQLVDSLIPLILSTPKHGEFLKRKRSVLEGLETKINTGLERSLSAAITWTKAILSEQKRTDFKPESEDIEMMQTSTCARVTKSINFCINKSRDCLDGKNVDAVMLELGTRFHRLIYDHLMQFQYTYLGAMIAICDVNEYRRCATGFKIPLINQLFDTLHALCNLLVVAKENLKQVCCGEALTGLDKSILMSFVQLRADCKSEKLINLFK